MTRVLVTGINSSLGQSVGLKLQAEGHIVVGTVRSPKISTRGLPVDELAALDLDNSNSFGNINGRFDAFIHVAGLSVGNTTELMMTNSLGIHCLIKRALELSVPRLIHISSMAVYGTGTEEVIGENSSVLRGNSYSISRWAGECIIANESSSIEAVSIRCPAIVGLTTHYHFLSKVFEKMINQDPLINASNPNFDFDNIVHEDVIADFVITLLGKESFSRYRAIPIGSTDPIPLREIIDVMAKATNYMGEINWVEPKTPPFRIDSTGAIELGYKPISTLETINRWMHDAKF